MSTTSFYRNHYDVLGIDRNASSDEIRRAYKKKALETHPDKLDPNATEKQKQAAKRHFHEVHEAFETLEDSARRKVYDARLKSRTDPALISEEAKRRVKERKEWAQRQKEEQEKRLTEANASLELEKQARKAADEKLKKEQAMVAAMLQEMYKLNPEFAARRQAALQRKAAREQADSLRNGTRATPVRPTPARATTV